MDQNYEQSFSTECYSGSQNPVSYSTSHSTSPRFKVFKYQPPSRTFDRPGSTVFTRERCYYRGRSRILRFLFNYISASQKRWWSTSSYKFAPLEPICRQEHIQNGHFEICKRNSSSRDWAVTLDIKDAYFHIPTHMKSRKFLRFLWRKKAFQFVVLPFGLSSAPRVFTLVFKA